MRGFGFGGAGDGNQGLCASSASSVPAELVSSVLDLVLMDEL